MGVALLPLAILAETQTLEARLLSSLLCSFFLPLFSFFVPWWPLLPDVSPVSHEEKGKKKTDKKGTEG